MPEMNAQYQGFLARTGRHLSVAAQAAHPKPQRRDLSIKAWDAAIEEAKARAERLKNGGRA